ncbi:hypothetical protein ACROYT_G039653 [Oculina patagonica]
MNQCLHHISAQYSEFMDVQMRYRSRLGLSQYVVRISNFSLDSIYKNSPDKRSRILLSYGEHAAEFFPVQSLFHLLKNITQGYDLPLGTYEGNFTRFVLNNFDLYILTIVNPDGRMIIERTRNYCWIGTANGADLNSDLEGNLGNRREVRIIAEPECRVMRDLTSKKQFDALISFHSGKRQIVFPTIGKNKVSGTDVFYLASLISSSSKSDFTLVPVNNTVADESIFSYASEEKQIPFTYKVFLWGDEETQSTTPEENCFSIFNPPSESLQAELQVVHQLYPTLFDFIHHWKETQPYSVADQLAKDETAETRKLSFITRLFLFVMGCICVILVCNIRVPIRWKMYFRRQRRIVSLRSLGTLFNLILIIP